MKKIKKHQLLSILLASVMICSGCGISRGEGATSDEATTSGEYTTTNEETTIEEATTTDEAVDDDVLKYIAYFKNPEIWDSARYCLSDSEINEIITSSDTQKECDHKYSFDVTDLRDKIIKNTGEYALSHEEYPNPFSRMEGTIVDMALRKVLDKIKRNATNDIEEDACRMQTLKIFFGTLKLKSSGEEQSAFLGIYDDKENKIILDYDRHLKLLDIEKGEEFEGDNFNKIYDSISKTLEHEINHCRQYSCDCRIKKGQEFNEFNYENKKLTFLTESSAESAIYNVDYIDYEEFDTYDYSYPDEREQESLLWLLSTGNDSVDKDDYYNAIFDTDLKSLYKFFNLEDDDDIKNFYRILSSLDSMLGRTDSVWEGKKVMTNWELQQKVGPYYINGMFNLILKNLVNYTVSEDDLLLCDNLDIYVAIKSILLEKLHYISYDNDDFDSNSLDEFKKSEKMYIRFLKEYYDTDMYTIEQAIQSSEWTAMDADYVSNGDNVKNDDYNCRVEKLFGKVPMLKRSLLLLDLYPFGYDMFDEENNTKQKSKK